MDKHMYTAEELNENFISYYEGTCHRCDTENPIVRFTSDGAVCDICLRGGIVKDQQRRGEGGD